MPDIFLSYSREDQSIARRFAQGFERAGFNVWWDVTLAAGDAYDQVTEKALQDAKAVVVLWSKRSVESRWVRAEATQALANGTLVPVMIGPCKRPIMFELTQTAELADWAGDAGDPAWQSFVAGLRRFIDAPAADAAATLPELGAPSATVAPAATQAPSIAVLPFLNMSSDTEQEFFVDGLSEELLNHLAQVPKLRVIGRTSSFAFKGRHEDLRKIGELLGVNHILEGSVRKAGDSLRITAKLIDPSTGYNVWSETYDRKLENIFAIQDEIARAVTEKLRLTISSKDRKSGTQNVAAYEDYLVGISKLRTPQPVELLDSLRYLDRATRLDPDFDDAWAALLDASFAVISIVPEQRVAAQLRADKLRATGFTPEVGYARALDRAAGQAAQAR